MSIFKSCDIRGVYSEELDQNTFAGIGNAVAAQLYKNYSRPRVVVGGDVRTSTPLLKERIINSLIESGCDVIDIGIAPTPLFYFAKEFLKVDAGLQVTASHNPKQYNGLKLMLGRLPITEEELEEVKHNFELGETNTGRNGGKLQKIDLTDEYVKFIEDKFKETHFSNLSVVMDASNGCYSEIAPRVFKDLGFKVERLNCEMDGNFPGHPPNPAVKENLTQLSNSVKSSNADYGICYDGDGDRVGFTDNRGNIVETDRIIVMLLRYILKTNPGRKIVYDIKCSSIVEEEIIKNEGIPIMEKSGHTFIKTRMITENCIFGGEISGHLFYDHLWGGDDGLYSSLLIGKIISETNEPLNELLSDMPRYYITPDIRIPYEKNDKEQILEKIRNSFDKVLTVDGVRVDFDDGWGLIRISVTEPMLTLRFESKSKENLPLIIENFLKPVPELKSLCQPKIDRILSQL